MLTQPLRRTRLPTGVQTFREVRHENLYYVDKTPFALRLVSQGKHFFLSRPRRFGKSLFVSMLQQLFEGHRELFKGLVAYDRWDWSVRHPVLLLEFSTVNATVPGNLDAYIGDRLLRLETEHGIECRYRTPAARLEDVIHTLHRRSGRRVVLLVDEYDKPITDALDQPELARANRDRLRGLYSVVQSCKADLRFSFITGVTNFSRVILFSNLNNLVDITLEPEFSSICGYSDEDVDTVFSPELEGLDRDKIHRWYNGYSWGGDERLYNPVDILLLFGSRRFRPWWFETGTPRFLPDTLVRRGISPPSLGGLSADDSLLSSFDIDEITTEALLFQTGYLTLAAWSEDEHGDRSYILGFPNREVRVSLNRALLSSLVDGLSDGRLTHCHDIVRHIRSADFAAMDLSVRAFFASIPDDWHRNNHIQRYVGYYASAFFALLSGFGLDTCPEEASSAGSIDIVVVAPERIVLFGFKVVNGRTGSGKALQQIREKGYAGKHRASGKLVHLVGMEFSTNLHNMVLIQWERVGQFGQRGKAR